jgi:predicted regulator of Ras-like GTPase activity (Roadblock/LC7/MglB family)
MRRGDLDRLVEVLKEPTRSFVREARVRTALLVNGAGQVLAQQGFTRSYEVVNVAALAAAAYAAARELGVLTGAGRWAHLHHAGRTRQIFLAPFRTPSGELIMVAIFDGDSSLGLVQLFFEKLVETVAALPEFSEPLPTSDQASFERDLEAGLETVFSPKHAGGN